MADLWLVLVLTSAIFGLIGYAFAKKSGRNPVVWAALGVILNFFVLMILPKLKRR